MIKKKRILSIILVMLTLFSSLPLIVFAEETVIDGTVYTDESEAYIINNSAAGADAVYEKGKTYSINGVDYFIEENGNVTVKGPALKGVPERVEILSKLGDFTVSSIAYGAFYNCKTVKEVILPETVTTISELAFKNSGLTNIEIKGKNVNIKTDFRGTPLFDNSSNWINDVLFVSGYAVVSYAIGELIFHEDVVGIGECCFKYSNSVTELTILNPDCHIPDSSENLPLHATTYGYKDSTAQKYAQNYGYSFSVICKCDDTVFIPATKSYCNGVVGYSEGYWCNNCNIYASGGLIDTTFEHMDSDEDNLCDFCKLNADAEISDGGKCGDYAVWTLSGDGVLRISGSGDVYTFDYANREPWYNRRNEIKTFIAEEGIGRLHGISFKEYQNLETVKMADTVLSIPKSFQDCTSLKNVALPRSFLAIPSSCFKGCTSLESIFIPGNVIEIKSSAFQNCTNLSDIDFETGYLALEIDAFYGTAAYNNPNNIKDGFLYIDNCLIAEITPGATTLVLGPEITSIASRWHSTGSKVTEIVVYNYDCAFPNDTGVLIGDVHLKGYVGSTAWFYSKKDFVALEPHTHTEVIDIPAVAPTDTEPGYTHFSHCAVCGETVTERELISPIEYNITVDEDITTAQKLDMATGENDGADIIITFAVRHDVCTSNIKQTVIYKVGEVKLSKTKLTYNGKVQKPTVIAKDSKGVTLVKDRDYRVTYSAESKYCGEYSVRVDYIGNYAGGKTLYYEIVIDAIFPTVSSSTAESIALSWEKGHSDLVYRVYSVDSKGNLSKIGDTKNGSYEVSSLESGSEYRFFVRAYVMDGNGKVYWGSEGDTISCATKADNTNNSMIDFLKTFIARIKYILQILLMIK